MKYLYSSLFILSSLFVSCQQKPAKATGLNISLGSKDSKNANEAVATFAEGCFWHSEIIFQSLKGVRDAVSGYAGGTDTDPDYEKVSTGETGHAEAVQVYYDPKQISYETLVDALFASMDPTQLNRQGNDRGTEYRSIAFYRNEKEKAIIEAAIKKIDDAKTYNKKIVTEVSPFKAFYPAEDYHQEYVYNHRDNNSYVMNVSIPDYLEFRSKFPAQYLK